MIICIDLETTGLDKYNDKIIEIAMVKFDEKTFKVIDTFSSLINPNIDIPEVISNLTNIFDTDVFGAPTIEYLKKEIEDFIGNNPILGHNISFDVGFLINNGIDINNNVNIDTFFLANFLCFTQSSLNLEVLSSFFGYKLEGAHRALNDVNATIFIFKKLINVFNKLSKEKKNILYYILNKSEDINILYIKEYLYGYNDVNIDFEKFERIILKNIGKLDNITDIYVDHSIDNNDIESFFDKLGTVEKRKNQLKMTNMVMDSFNKGKLSTIEAPTGLGKSFAYLIPSIIHSIRTGEKIFISTKTKTLQDQLYFKDLTFLKEKMGLPFSFTKLKGKRNYLSVKSFFDELFLGDIDYSKIGFLLKITLWFYETKYGEIDELNFFGIEFSYLRSLQSDNFSILNEKSKYREYEYLFKARTKLENSNIVVINHSLLFSDLNSEGNSLGKIQNLVIDEAHNIEDSVTDSLRQKYSSKILGDFFDGIEKILNKYNIKKIQFLRDKEDLLSKLGILDDYGFNYINNNVGFSIKYKTILLKDDFFNEDSYDELMKKIELNFIDIIDNLSVISEYDFTKEVNFLLSNLDILKIMLVKKTDKEFIKILNYNDKAGVTFEYTLLNPGEYLHKNLWIKLKTCILTSATLQISNSFDYFKKLLFLENFDFYLFESDFDYKKQATLFIPTDLGSIKNNEKEVLDFLLNFYLVAKGSILTLLTSFVMIKNIYTNSNLKLKQEGINLYAQGFNGSKNKLIKFYLDNPKKSIILGTDSFWEGVDIPGESLKYLIIHKFPFSVPNDPIFQARSIFFKDSFRDYSIPKAIIKLKQGFGRLIRTKTDTGIIILLDDRIINTKWGTNMLNAFPNTINIKKGKVQLFIDILKNINN